MNHLGTTIVHSKHVYPIRPIQLRKTYQSSKKFYLYLKKATMSLPIHYERLQIMHMNHVVFQHVFTHELLAANSTAKLGLSKTLVVLMPGKQETVFIRLAAHVTEKP